ncbi:hypothetical protein GCM10027053_17430 [Intrasporangium mesophilum]
MDVNPIPAPSLAPTTGADLTDAPSGPAEHLPSRPARRQFLLASAAGTLTAAAWTLVGAPAARASGPVASGPAARIEPLNVGWEFGPASGGPTRTVTLPHSVTQLGWRLWDSSRWEKVWRYTRQFDHPQPSGKLRTFIDFGGVLTTTRGTINGRELPVHRGGYLPFSYEVTDDLRPTGNVLTLEVDARWDETPPSGSPLGAIGCDYFQPAGVYRDASIRLVPQVFVAEVHATPRDVLDPAARRVEVAVTLDAALAVPTGSRVDVRLTSSSGQVVTQTSAPVTLGRPGRVDASVTLDGLAGVDLWHPDHPALYSVEVTLVIGGEQVHSFTRRIGFREARFENNGFFLNGSRFKLFGLNRHQLYPFVGMSMSPRMQRSEAAMLRNELNCNMVRCSHYPQSEHFLDACDELGLMIWEETPGWGFVGGDEFKELVVQDVRNMVLRDRHRPSVIIWGVQVNESDRDPVLWGRTRDLAYELDGTRQTSGSATARNLTNWVQDVFAYDDYGHSRGNATISAPLAGTPYLVTESIGALSGPPGYRRIDGQVVLQTQSRMHAQVHNTSFSNNGYAGLLGWCGFDYASLAGGTFWSTKWPGVVDLFRVPKPGAAFYQAQVSPFVRPVLQPAFFWSFEDPWDIRALGSSALIWSNCDRLEVFVGGTLNQTLTPRTSDYPRLPYPPFAMDTSAIDGAARPELRIDGYVGGNLVVSRRFDADPARDRLAARADHDEIVADGSDITRVEFRSVDSFGEPRPWNRGDVAITISGPGTIEGAVVTVEASAEPELIRAGGESVVTARLASSTFPFSENGGVGAVFVRSVAGQPGPITVTLTHPELGTQRVAITATADPGLQGPAAWLRATPRTQRLVDPGLALSLPAGWTAEPLDGAPGGAVAPGASVSRRWRVTAPATVPAGAPTAVGVEATYVLNGEAGSGTATVPVRLATSLQEAYNLVGITDDSDTSKGDWDGRGRTYSRQALAAVGLTPGLALTHRGAPLVWPAAQNGEPDHFLTSDRAVSLSGKGSALVIVGASSYTVGVARAVVYYRDGSQDPVTFMLEDNTTAPAPEFTVLALTTYSNRPEGQNGEDWRVLSTEIPLDPAKELDGIAFLDGGYVAANARIRGMHVFSLGVRP